MMKQNIPLDSEYLRLYSKHIVHKTPREAIESLKIYRDPLAGICAIMDSIRENERKEGTGRKKRYRTL